LKGLNLNGINQLIFVMVKCCFLFEVRTEFLNIIETNFGFKGLSSNLCFRFVSEFLWWVYPAFVNLLISSYVNW